MSEKNIFNENSPIWIRIFRKMGIILFFIIIIAGVISMFAMPTWKLGVLSFIGSAVFAFFYLVFHMLIINYLNNIQIIREEICYINDKADGIEPTPFQDEQEK